MACDLKLQELSHIIGGIMNKFWTPFKTIFSGSSFFILLGTLSTISYHFTQPAYVNVDSYHPSRSPAVLEQARSLASATDSATEENATQIQNLNKKIQSFIEEIDSLKEKKASLEIEANMQKQKTSIQINHLKTEIGLFEDAVSLLVNELNKAQNELQTLEAKETMVREELVFTTKTIDRLLTEAKSLNLTISDLKTRLSDETSKREAAEGKVKKLEEELAQARCEAEKNSATNLSKKVSELVAAQAASAELLKKISSIDDFLRNFQHRVSYPSLLNQGGGLLPQTIFMTNPFALTQAPAFMLGQLPHTALSFIQPNQWMSSYSNGPVMSPFQQMTHPLTPAGTTINNYYMNPAMFPGMNSVIPQNTSVASSFAALQNRTAPQTSPWEMRSLSSPGMFDFSQGLMNAFDNSNRVSVFGQPSLTQNQIQSTLNPRLLPSPEESPAGNVAW